MIAKPVISPDFTIEDIHKIREYHYELTKDMTTQERINFYNEGGSCLLYTSADCICFKNSMFVYMSLFIMSFLILILYLIYTRYCIK